ncbi:MAG: thioredoxin family protein [Pseudomonadota bacterium]
MVALNPPVCDFDWPAPDFTLPATDGSTYSLRDISGENGTLIMFICNHCPFVLAITDRIVRDSQALQAQGIDVAAICSNDAVAYPADSFENMKKLATEQGFTFPYLHDEDQSMARAYKAVCTPDFFGFNRDLGLQYRGRLDASRMEPAPADQPRELYDAMVQVAKTGQGPAEQIASIGCSIKWAASP